MIFSHVAKVEKTIMLEGDRHDSRAVYGFHEALVNVLRLRVKEGVKSVVVASPSRSVYGQEFVRHVKDHHLWLVQGQSKLAISEIVGSAGTLAEASELVRSSEFRRLISEAVSEEGENLIEVLEQNLAASDSRVLVMYSFDEIEGVILGRSVVGKVKPDYLLLTNKYLAQSRQRGRLNRLMQVAQNRGVKTRIVDADSKAGLRLTQFGGMVCIAKVDSQ
jgi:stalled ribosome rescue protein Dom34